VIVRFGANLGVKVMDSGSQKTVFDSFDTPVCQKPLFIKQVEEVEDAWRVSGGKKSLKNKANGGSGGFWRSCVQKNKIRLFRDVF